MPGSLISRGSNRLEFFENLGREKIQHTGGLWFIQGDRRELQEGNPTAGAWRRFGRMVKMEWTRDINVCSNGFDSMKLLAEVLLSEVVFA